MSARLNTAMSLPRIEELPDDPAVLRGVVGQLLKLLTAANGKVETLQAQVEQLVRRLYGRSSEKWDPDQSVMDALLATVVEQGPVPAAPAAASVKIAAHARKVPPHGRSIFPETLKHEEVIIPVPEAERRCPITGQARPLIGYEETKKLDYRPSELVVKVYKREKLGSVANAEETGVVTAPAVDSVVPKSLMDHGLLAQVVVSKFVDHLPLYRQENIFARQGVSLSRRTMSDTLVAAAEPLSRLSDLVGKKVLESGLVHHDDTPVDLLTEGTSHTRGIKEARLWVATVPVRDGPWTHFTFTTSRESRHIEEFFKGYRGSVMSDDFIGYGPLEGADIVRLLCWAHTRRKFFEAQNSNPAESAEMLERIGGLYRLERSVESGPEHDDTRLRMRREQALPQLEAILERLKAWSGPTPPKTPLGKAVSYAIDNWPFLIRYVEDPRRPLDNNPAEQTIRPVALGRKNWLFMGSERGGRAAAVYMTLVATCKRAQVNPFDYLRDVFARLMAHSTHKLDDLLPGNWKPLTN